MAEPSTRNSQIGVILERIDDLRGDMRETKDKLSDLSREIGDFRLSYTGEHQTVVLKVDAAHSRLDQHEVRIKAIENALPQLVMMSKVLTFVGSAVVLSIIGLIWAILTHQAVIAFP